MSSVSYNTEELDRVMDVKAAILNFGDRQEFFNALTALSDGAGNALVVYTPLNILERPDVTRRFLKELKDLRDTLESLAMQSLVINTMYIEAAVIKKESSELEKALLGLISKLERVSEQIKSAKIEVKTEPGEKRLILAVDDKPTLLVSVAEMLAGSFKVLTVTNGKAALKAIEKFTPELFLLDIEMPVMDGFELAEKLRQDERFSETPIIFLTAKGTRGDVVTAIHRGGNDYIVKPVDKFLLLEKLYRWLGD